MPQQGQGQPDAGQGGGKGTPGSVTDGSEVTLQLPALRGSWDEDTEDFTLSEFPATPSSGLLPSTKTPQCEHITPGMLAPINR